MDPAFMTATAAGLGSLVGASASIATTLITQRTQSARATTEWQLRERESLYKSFIMEASRLAVDALSNSLQQPGQLVTLYALLSQIRLMSGEDVLDEAQTCCRRIVDLYSRPNLTGDEIRAAYEANQIDPLKDFSTACRAELLAMSSRV